MRTLTLIEKLLVGALVVGLMAFAFGSSVATAAPLSAVPPQGSAPQDDEVDVAPSVYWILFVRGDATGGQIARMAYVEEDGCRAVEKQALADPNVQELSGCVRVEMKAKSVEGKESAQ